MAENNIISDLQSSGEVLIDLFELDLGTGETLYFHPGTDENYSDLVFDGNTYKALPLEMSGIELLSDGANNRPTLTIANVTNVLKTALNDETFKIGDLVGTRFKRRRTLEKYLGTPTEIFEFPSASYIIDRMSAENNLMVEFELASPFDVDGVQIPARVIIGKYCSWIYQGKDVKNCGGCPWLADSSFYLEDDGVLKYAFFDSEDRPLIEAIENPVLPTDPPQPGYSYIIPAEGTWPSWSSSTSYAKDALVYHLNKYWRSDFPDNQEEPSSTALGWTEFLLFMAWEAQSYEAGSYVRHTITREGQKDITIIWKCVLSHSSSQEPDFGSPYWSRADSCSKTLGGCKARFQYKEIDGAQLPSSSLDTSRTLPFGAFPGSVKFK